ncbi:MULTISPECIES: hypothetical protein [Legionella]|uniref:Uncharacterized protein n=1 Tax=Legionella drozanskii LLAP-1 TaxID=1212489 RepID=A0A0W0TDW4_9GAMM|nr:MULTISPECIES: hypothetical protein [Legionella]KTC93785.1 hypothetical protein Ldro_0135 [Legionella drozanskii LLAP-1]
MANFSFAKPCIYNGSCFKLNNQHNQSAEIVCHSKYNGFFPVEAAGNSDGSTQFDISLNDGMGSPEPGQLQCEINFPGNEASHSFSFHNPFWGPTMEFTLLSARKMTIVAYDKWGSNQKYFDFSW